MTSNLSGGAPLFIMCLCLQSGKDVSSSFISLSLPYRQKLSCLKMYFPCLSGTIRHSWSGNQNIPVLCLDIYVE